MTQQNFWLQLGWLFLWSMFHIHTNFYSLYLFLPNFCVLIGNKKERYHNTFILEYGSTLAVFEWTNIMGLPWIHFFCKELNSVTGSLKNISYALSSFILHKFGGFLHNVLCCHWPSIKRFKKKSLKKLVHSVHPTSTSVELLDGLGNFWFIIYNLETDT